MKEENKFKHTSNRDLLIKYKELIQVCIEVGKYHEGYSVTMNNIQFLPQLLDVKKEILDRMKPMETIKLKIL